MCDISKIIKMVNMCKNCIKHEVTCIGSDEQQERCFALLEDANSKTEISNTQNQKNSISLDNLDNKF